MTVIGRVTAHRRPPLTPVCLHSAYCKHYLPLEVSARQCRNLLREIGLFEQLVVGSGGLFSWQFNRRGDSAIPPGGNREMCAKRVRKGRITEPPRAERQVSGS